MFGYNIINTPDFYIDTKSIDKIFKDISKIVEINQKGLLNIVFIDSESIKNLNKNYRNIDKRTDVLSFHYFSDFSKLKKDEIAWEIIICNEIVKSQWLEYWLWTEKEFYKLLIHSILHILGYDHEIDDDYKIMSGFEKLIWKEVFEK